MKRILSYATNKRIAYAAAALVVVAGGWYFFGRGSSNATHTIVLAPQTFEQQIAVSGKVVAAKDVDLGFSTGGRIARVYVAVGDRVSVGATLAEAENGDLRANVEQQQALLSQQQAKLASLQAGAQPEDIAASQAALDKAKQDLANYYQSIIDSAQDGYTKANDATRTQLNGFFSNPESNNPQLNFSSSNSQSVTAAQTARVDASVALNTWYSQLSTAGTSNTQLEKLLADSLGHLATVRDLLAAVSSALDGAGSLIDSTRATYRASVVTGQAEVNTAIKNLNTASQNIASQKLTVSQLQAQLDLKRAGSTPQDIAAQQALVGQAQASVASAVAQLQKTIITAPFSGTITTVDAKVGLAAAVNTPQISMQSAGTFQIESYVPEVNIAKVAVGDQASVTLDAYGTSAPFVAAVVSIDPAETIRDGVSTYRVVLQFSQADERIRSGMTATLAITTNRKENALVVPQGAIFEKNGQQLVQVRRNGELLDVPVVVGDLSVGNAEVTSGLSAGDEVVLSPDTSR